MLRNNHAALRAPVLWFRVRSTTAGGRSCREYTIVGDDDTHLLDARAFTWGRQLEVVEPSGAPFLSIVRSRAFVLSGRADVLGTNPKEPLGRLSRNGTFRSPSGAVIGRYRDARSLGSRARESLAQGLFEAVLNSGEAAGPSGPDMLVLQAGGEVRATLTYSALPPIGATELPSPRPAGKFLPARLRTAWRALTAPRGWRLARAEPLDGDPRLDLAAALFAAELSRW